MCHTGQLTCACVKVCSVHSDFSPQGNAPSFSCQLNLANFTRCGNCCFPLLRGFTHHLQYDTTCSPFLMLPIMQSIYYKSYYAKCWIVFDCQHPQKNSACSPHMLAFSEWLEFISGVYPSNHVLIRLITEMLVQLWESQHQLSGDKLPRLQVLLVVFRGGFNKEVKLEDIDLTL